MTDDYKNVKICIALLIILGIIVFWNTARNNSKEEQRENLRNGLNKYYTGEKMTKEEYDMTKSYFEWKSDQETEKTYDAWE